MWAVACWSTRPACSIIKHTTPCGIAVGRTAARRSGARAPPTRSRPSARVIAFNTVVDRATAAGDERPLRRGRGGAVVPRRGARGLRRARRTLRVVELPVSRGAGIARLQAGARRLPGAGPVPVRSRSRPAGRWPPTAQPTEREWNDLRFAWAAVASVKSNAILLARDEAAIGIGAGQMSRVDSVFLAVHKARQAGPRPGRQRARLRRLLSLRRRRRAGGRAPASRPSSSPAARCATPK